MRFLVLLGLLLLPGIVFSACMGECARECCTNHGGRMIQLTSESMCESRLDCTPIGTENQQEVGCEKRTGSANFNKYNILSCVNRCMDCCARTGSACDTGVLEEKEYEPGMFEEEIEWSEERMDEICTPSPVIFGLLLLFVRRH